MKKVFGHFSIALFAAALNILVFILIPLLQILFGHPPAREKSSEKVVAEVSPAPQRPNQKIEKKELKAVKSLMAQRTRPNSPSSRNVQFDLSVADGGEGVSVASGQIGAMTYLPGETDTDVSITRDCALEMPLRARRESVTGYVDVFFVVNESGTPVEIEMLREEPPGYGFFKQTRACISEMRFRPATLKDVPVRQKVSRRFSFELD